jgi:hypothetical protein
MSASAIATAARALHERGWLCLDAEDGGLLLSRGKRRGWTAAAADARVRVRLELGGCDPVTLARLAAGAGSRTRVVLRDRRAATEEICDPAAAGETAERLWGLGTVADAETAERLDASAAGDTAARPVGSAPTAALAIPPVVDVTVGILEVAVPELTAPAFLRLALPEGDPIDGARAAFLLVANADLHAAIGGWADGPGLAVDPADAEPAVLRRELAAVGEALRALGEPRIARSYLALCGPCHVTPPRAPVVTGPGAATDREPA